SYTRLINQIRSALVGCYPQFEQAIRGQIFHRKWVLHLLARYGGPTKIKRLGKAKAAAFARRYKARNPEPVIDAIFAAIAEQTVTIAGAHYAEMGVAMSAKDALLKLEHR
nr:IS110 family transposase [Corynebacterium sp. MSK090]